MRVGTVFRVAIVCVASCLALEVSMGAESAADMRCDESGDSVLTNLPISQPELRARFAQRGWSPDDVTLTEVNNAGVRQLRVAGRTGQEIRDALSTFPDAYYVEPDYPIAGSEVIPNDEHFKQQWALKNDGSNGPGSPGLPRADIAATAAWDISQGSPAVTIAILDSGIDYRHKDLSGNLWRAGESFSITLNAGPPIVCKSESRGFDAINSKCERAEDIDDKHGHGTHVAGIAGARGGNGIGIAGVAWESVLLPVKVLDDENTGRVSSAIRAMEFLLQLNANPRLRTRIRILSNSWGYSTMPDRCFSRFLREQIQRMGDAGMLFVAAAGNGRKDIDSGAARFYPASFNLPNMLTVTATGKTDALLTNWGTSSVHVAAPGVDIYSTIPGRNSMGGPPYGEKSGSSMAVPFVSGVAALLWSHCPGVTTAAVKAAIIGSVDRLPELASRIASGGRLNAYAALRRVEHDAAYPACALH